MTMMTAIGDELHRRGDVRQWHHDGRLDQPRQQRPHGRHADLPPAPSTNDARQSSNRLATVAERCRQRRRCLGLGGDNPRRRPHRAHRRADAAQQAAAADRADDRIDVGKVFENLESQRRVADDESVVVEGVNESAAHAGRGMCFDRLPALVVGRGHQRGSQPANGVDLRSRRGVHHHHRAGNAGVPGSERDALAGVSALTVRRRRRSSTLSCRTALRLRILKRADRLQRLELEEDLRGRRMSRSGR